MSEVTKESIDADISNFEPNINVGENEKELWGYRILLTAPFVGPFNTADEITDKICDFWETDRPDVKTMIRRSWMNRIIRYGKRYQEHFLDGEIYEDDGVIGLALGCAVLCGLIRREKE